MRSQENEERMDTLIKWSKYKAECRKVSGNLEGRVSTMTGSNLDKRQRRREEAEKEKLEDTGAYRSM